MRGPAAPFQFVGCKRLRRRLGHDYKVENAAWWNDRLDDVDRLDIEASSAKHAVVMGTVSVLRLRLCGKRPPRAGTRLGAQGQAQAYPALSLSRSAMQDDA